VCNNSPAECISPENEWRLNDQLEREYIYTFQEEEESCRFARNGTTTLFFVGRCIDNFEVILM